MKKQIICFLVFLVGSIIQLHGQHSVSRLWNEQVLEAIRDDFARPTVHARNLFHTSAAMYDAWAAYNPSADTYFLGKNNHGFTIPFALSYKPTDIVAAQEEAMSFAVYRLINHRFKNAPFIRRIKSRANNLMKDLAYDRRNTSTDYNCGPAELGNYIAAQIILFGKQDGSNEENDYSNQYYQSENPPLLIEAPGNPNILNLNKWQPLELSNFIDQAGNPTGDNIPDFLSPEWGSVFAFSLQETDVSNFERAGFNYKLYHDPGPPAYIEDDDKTGIENLYKWGHAMVSVWSSHHNPNDTSLINIAPSAMGNISEYPTAIEDYPSFYNFFEGGDNGKGHDLNPHTQLPYSSNFVKRSDYSRILAEFWADGPDSETPPGHWFTILNTVNDHPELVKKLMGQGAILDDLEWDVKSYFMLGGAMHDVAITAWGIKGKYDYIRPVSAIRGMAEYGQGSDTSLANYSHLGLPLIPGFIEVIEEGDLLQGLNGENIGETKVYAWRGPIFINDPEEDVAKAGWVPSKLWWPYQRPSFVTPPFAGYVSGHSTYSRAAAEVLTALTGDPFFPGGVGEFECPKNEFLVFENGPSEDITLQWATYRDASDQCSLSRIWGGIHPPVDDIPGRLIGEKIGIDAFNYARSYFTKSPEASILDAAKIFPINKNCGLSIQHELEGTFPAQVFQYDGKLLFETNLVFKNNQSYIEIDTEGCGILILVVKDQEGKILFKNKIVIE